MNFAHKENRVRQLLKMRAPLGTHMKASNRETSAWIGLYWLDLSDPRIKNVYFINKNLELPDAGINCWRIHHFEVSRELIEKDIWPGPTDIITISDDVALGEEELEKKLNALGIRLVDLRRTADIDDYPL